MKGAAAQSGDGNIAATAIVGARHMKRLVDVAHPMSEVPERRKPLRLACGRRVEDLQVVRNDGNDADLRNWARLQPGSGARSRPDRHPRRRHRRDIRRSWSPRRVPPRAFAPCLGCSPATACRVVTKPTAAAVMSLRPMPAKSPTEEAHPGRPSTGAASAASTSPSSRHRPVAALSAPSGRYRLAAEGTGAGRHYHRRGRQPGS